MPVWQGVELDNGGPAIPKIVCFTYNSSEKRGFCSRGKLQNLPKYKKAHIVFFHFSLQATLSFTLWMP